MSVEHRQSLPAATKDCRISIGALLTTPHGLVNSDKCPSEDGEISERDLSGGTRNAWPPQRPHGQSQAHPSNQIMVSTPTPSSTTETVRDRILPTVEPLTKEDLDRAKSLVLDLLGWGVTPEYLVECGLSPGTVYKIFTDLQLRLPRNLGVSTTGAPGLHHDGAR